MKGMDVIDALAEVREDWLEDAAPKGGRKPPQWAKLLSLAACLTVLVAFSGVMLLRFVGGQGQQGSVQTPSIAAAAAESSQEEAPALSEQEQFYACFYQLDQSSMEAYVDAHPEVLEHGWSGIDINAAGLEDSGTELYTTQGDQVLALDAQNGILLIRVVLDGDGNNSRGILAICKDTSLLRLCAASTLPDSGETVGTICRENGGLLALTGSAFLDDGSSDGGIISGLAVCGGASLGTAMGAAGDKRLELRQDDRMYIVDSADPMGEGTRDACEFGPALIVDGKNVAGGGSWNTPQPRAVIGQSDRLETMMVVIEGRLTDSIGCGIAPIAEKLLEYGCVQAMNLDGGTSAILYYKGQYITRCSYAELPEGRKLPTAWVYGYDE
jgi:hypothetical protein